MQLDRIRFDESEAGFRFRFFGFSESSFDVDSLAKPEVTSVSQM